jgi:cyclophilin family peptidyl-prolyl cis-trans isomerase
MSYLIAYINCSGEGYMSPARKPRKRVGNPPQKLQKKSNKWLYIAVICIVVAIAVIGFVILRYAPSTNPTNQSAVNPVAIIDTSMGKIRVELYQDKAPITTANFMKLINISFFTDLVFHRVANLDTNAPTTHIIQGGGFYANGTYKTSPFNPINLETKSDLLHDDGAIAMARTTDKNSATSQFYICDGPQHFLDGQYAVFGKVVDNASMDVVREIANVPTGTRTAQGQSMTNWPVNDVVIYSITLQK